MTELLSIASRPEPATLHPVSPIQRPERFPPTVAGDEATTLWSMLDYYRGTLVSKCSELTDDQLRKLAVPPSTLSLLGLLRHMADVEIYWFATVFAGDDAAPPFDPANTGADFDNLSEKSGDEVVEIFLSSVARSKEIVHGKDLSTLSVVARPSRGHVNLRFIGVHLVEEYARHCGHADLLREVLDGETGD